MRWLLDHQPLLTTDDHWRAIDTHERSAGEPRGRPRAKVVSVAEGRVEEQGTPAQIFGAPTSPRLTQFLSTWRDRQADAQLG